MKSAVTLIAILATLMLPAMAVGQTTQFIYQGQLTDSGAPQATYQMRFRLFDALASGGQVGGTIENASVAVDGGIFTVALDFGAPVFSGADRFLEIAVRRNSGESYTVLSPRQLIASSPYSIRTLSAQTADLALDAEKLGGLDADQYLTNASVGSAFVRNDTAEQTANFNISGTGLIGSALGIGVLAPGPGYDLDVGGAAQFMPGGSGGSIALGTPNAETGMSIVGTNRADIRFDGTTLKLVAGAGAGTPPSLNGLSINTAGQIGAGTAPNGNFRLDSFGSMRAYSTTAAHFVAETTGGTNTWARFYMRSSSRSWLIGTSQNFNGNQLYIADETADKTRLAIATNGNVGIGTSNPGARLAVSTDTNSAGNNTAYFEAPAIGPNASNVHFGTTGDWYVRSAAASGKVVLQDTGGNVGIGTANPNAKLSVVGSVTQDHLSRGLPKAMLLVLANGTIHRCYNGTNGSTTSGCGFGVTNTSTGLYTVNFGFNISQAFFSALGAGGLNAIALRTFHISDTSVGIFTFWTYDDSGGPQVPSDFYLLVY